MNKLNLNDPKDKAEAQRVFNEKSIFIKDTSGREDALIYKKIEAGNPNAFNISPSYDLVKSKQRD